MASAPFPLVSREGRAKLVPQMKAGRGGGKVSDAWTLALEAKREPRRAAGPEERRYAEWNETERRVRAASKNQHFAVGSWGAQLGPAQVHPGSRRAGLGGGPPTAGGSGDGL